GYMFKFKIFIIGIGCIAFGIYATSQSGQAIFLLPVLFGVLCSGGVIWSIAYKINRDRSIIENAKREREAALTTTLATPLYTDEEDHDTDHIRLGRDPEKGKAVSVSDVDRFSGSYILGVQGSGKSALMLNLILQDIYTGKSVIVVDPHSDL